MGSLSVLLGIFPTQGSKPGLPHCRQTLYQLGHKGSPKILKWLPYSIKEKRIILLMLHYFPEDTHTLLLSSLSLLPCFFPSFYLTSFVSLVTSQGFILLHLFHFQNEGTPTSFKLSPGMLWWFVRKSLQISFDFAEDGCLIKLKNHYNGNESYFKADGEVSGSSDLELSPHQSNEVMLMCSCIRWEARRV